MIVNCSYNEKKYKNYDYYVALPSHNDESSLVLYVDNNLYELMLALASFEACHYLSRHHKVIT